MALSPARHPNLGVAHGPVDIGATPRAHVPWWPTSSVYLPDDSGRWISGTSLNVTGGLWRGQPGLPKIRELYTIVPKMEV